MSSINPTDYDYSVNLNSSFKKEEENQPLLKQTSSTSIKDASEISHEEAPHPESLEKAQGGGILKKIAKTLGIKESYVASIAGYAILGSIVGIVGGPIGVVAGAALGAIIGGILAYMETEEPEEHEQTHSLEHQPLSLDENIHQKEAEIDPEVKVKGGNILKQIGHSLGISEELVGKIADYAILGALVGGSGGAFGMGIGAVPGVIVGALVGVATAIIMHHMLKQIKAAKEETALAQASHINQNEASPTEPPQKGGGIFKTISCWSGISETCIGNVAWCSILGADAGAIAGPIGIGVGAGLGLILGILITKPEHPDIPHPENVDPHSGTHHIDEKLTGGKMFNIARSFIQVSEEFIAHVAGCAILGIEMGEPLGATGMIAGALLGVVFGLGLYALETGHDALTTHEIKDPAHIHQGESHCDLKSNIKGGHFLKSMRNFADKYHLTHIAECSVEYAILGGCIGVFGGPLGLVLAGVVGGIVGGVIGCLVALNEEDEHGHGHHSPQV